MKDIINVIQEEQNTNESILASTITSFDISLIALISSTLSSLISIGIGVSGQIVRAMIGSKNRDAHGKMKVELLQNLKNFVRDLDVDLTKNQAAMSVINDPGEWSTEMCSELRNAVYNQLNDDQKKIFDKLEASYIKERNRFVKF